MPRSATAKQKRVWNKSAPTYDDKIAGAERSLLRGGREWIGSRASGRVLEVAIGTGRSLPFYPDAVELTGVDLSPGRLALARRLAAELGREVELLEADAEHLPFEDHAFDTVVCQLALCSIPRPEAAVAEMARVLKPGGRLLLFDHVGSTFPPLWVLQWIVERVTIPAAGEHFTRRPRQWVEAVGLTVEEDVRLKAGTVERLSAVLPV
jgi:ubiquinone/menaquinone biosynthesis C-methylase UbiE